MALLTTSPQTRAKVVGTRTVAQVAALIAAIAAGAAVAANFISGPGSAEPAKIEVREVNTEKFNPPTVPHAKADLDGIASRLMLVSNSPKITPPEAVDPAVPPPAPPSSIKDHIKFLGVVADGAKLYALIAIDGKQRIVGIGDVIRLAGDITATVTEITTESVSIDDGKKVETINVAHRTGSSVGHAAAPITAPASSARLTQDPRARGARNVKEAKDALAGLDPKARALVEANNARAAQIAVDAREMRRKARRIELEKETGRQGEEIEKMLDEMEQSGKFGDIPQIINVAKEKPIK